MKLHASIASIRNKDKLTMYCPSDIFYFMMITRPDYSYLVSVF